MGNINLYKSTTGKAPWTLVKENITSPVTITESTGGSLYYAVRDEGDSGNIEPSDYKIISKPVYVFKSTDKISNITFDDKTDINSLIVKVTSTCGDTANHKVQVQINVKNTGWKNFTKVAIGANIQARYTTAATDGVTEGNQIKFRAYIVNNSNANYRTNNSAEYVYTLEYNEGAPAINGSMPIDSRGYGNSSLSNIYSIFNTTGSISYGKGPAIRIPLTIENIFTMFTSSSSIDVSFGYKILKIGVLSGLKTNSFFASNVFYNTLGTSPVDTTQSVEFPIPYALDGKEKNASDKLPMGSMLNMKKATITFLGVNFKYYGFKIERCEYLCSTGGYNVTPIIKSNNIGAIVCHSATVISSYGACEYYTALDTGISVGMYFRTNEFKWGVEKDIPNNENYISLVEHHSDDYGEFDYKSFVIIT